MNAFLRTFAGTFVGTAIPLGMLIYAVLRDDGRKYLEERLDRFDAHIRNAKLPVVTRFAQRSATVLGTIYQAEGVGPAVIAFVLTLGYVAIISAALYCTRANWVPTARQEKLQLEHEADPWLYSRSEAEIARAKAGRVVGIKDNARWVYDNDDADAVRIRESILNYDEPFRKSLRRSSRRISISLLWMLEGTKFHPFSDFPALLSFLIVNTVIDFVSFVLAMLLLKRIAASGNVLIATAATLMMFAAALLLAAFLHYLYLACFAGSLSIFFHLFCGIPFLLVVGLIAIAIPISGVGHLIAAIRGNRNIELPSMTELVGSCFYMVVVGGAAVAYWRMDPFQRFAVPPVGGSLTWVPIAFASTPLLPLVIIVGMAFIAIAVKLGMEFLRELMICFHGSATLLGATKLGTYVLLLNVFIAGLITLFL